MTEQAAPTKSLWLITWTAIRFVVFGVGGFIALWFGCILLLDSLVGIPVSLAGGLMMLFGSGMWKRWAYLWVFFSIPSVVASAALLVERYHGADWLFATPVLILLVATPMPVSYLLVRRYYKQREAPQPSSTPTPQITTNEEVPR